MLPYTIAFFFASTALFAAWYLFDIPLGPGIERTYTPGQHAP